MHKKGATEMIETIMVLVVVIILIMIGIVFYFKTSAASIEETGMEVCQLSGNDLLIAATALPEIQCSIGAVPKDCIDLEKVAAFQSLLKDSKTRSRYESYFSGSCPKKVRIDLVYPAPEASGECQAGQEVGKCKTWTVFTPKKETKSKQMVSTPVSVYSMGRYYIGRITVEINK